MTVKGPATNYPHNVKAQGNARASTVTKFIIFPGSIYFLADIDNLNTFSYKVIRIRLVESIIK